MSLACAAACLAGVATPSGGAQASSLATLHTFCSKRLCADGTEPQTALTMDAAGNLYGFAGDGDSAAPTATVYELVPNPGRTRWKLDVLYSPCSECLTIRGRLVVDTVGNLYATVFEGGTHGTGEVVEFPVRAGKTKRKLQVLYNFASAGGDGNNPASGLTYQGAASGLPYDGVSPLYGTTFQGGSHAKGALYQLTPSGGTWTESVVYSFCSQGGSACTDGATPLAAPSVDGSGNLYGTTRDGGNSSGNGTIYELTNAGGTWTETVLHTNCQQPKCSDGAAFDEILIDASGNLFGNGFGGTHHGAGIIFKLVPSGTASTYSVLYDFCAQRNCSDGVDPAGGLVIDSSGNLFGATMHGGGHDNDTSHAGGGTVFEFSGSALTTLHAFCSQTDCADGEYPPAGLVMDGSGNLLGTTQAGGRQGEGTAFALTP